MVKHYCNCLNICVQFAEHSDLLDEYNLTDEEKQNDFFQLLPLIIVQHCIISEQHTALVQLNVVGSWIVHKCAHCSVYTHAMKSDESTTVMFINGSLKKMSDRESEQKRQSSEFSPVFQILVADFMYHPMDYNGTTSHLPSETSNSIIELKELVAEKIEERQERTKKLIEQFVLEQETALKNFIKRANNDFQSIKTAVLSNCASEQDEEDTDIKMSVKKTRETNSSNSVINEVDLLTNTAGADKSVKDKNRSNLLEYQTSLDYEGLFPLDGMENNDVVNEDEDHSEEDPSDTDDSGSRDEGIHIPRIKNVAMARSLPIRVRTDFDPSLRIFDEDDDDKRKPNYKRKMRNERPVDIAASMKALANSVYGDTIFGDLPPPRIGSRI